MSNSKVIFITGASSGIGKATALYLLEQSHNVYATARRLEKMQAIKERGGHTLKMDVTNHAEVKEVISSVVRAEGKIDVLVNNAGYAVYGPVEEVSYTQAIRQFEVNLFGLAEVTKATLATMRAQRSGLIINVSSVAGKVYLPLGAWYIATKHALEGWSDCLRLEVKPLGLKVVIIEPGAVKTEFDVAMDQQFEDVENSPYASLKTTMKKVTEEAYSPGNYSEPIVIAKTIAKAINSPNPKTRYAAGKLASQTLLGRKFLSDKQFDKMIMNLVNKMAKKQSK